DDVCDDQFVGLAGGDERKDWRLEIGCAQGQRWAEQRSAWGAEANDEWSIGGSQSNSPFTIHHFWYHCRSCHPHQVSGVVDFAGDGRRLCLGVVATLPKWAPKWSARLVRPHDHTGFDLAGEFWPECVAALSGAVECAAKCVA